MRPRIAALILVLLLASFGLVAFAQENTEDVDDALDCDALEELVDKKVAGYLARETEHTLTYQILWLKVAALARKADVYGLDTADLYDDLDELDELTDEFTKNFATFTKSLNNTKKYICSTNETKYANSLKQTKEDLGDLRKTTKDIAQLYNEDIRKDILDLKEGTDEQE